MRNADELSQLHGELRACRACLQAGHDIVPGAVMSGSAAAEALIIGQAPGVTEVEAKRPFNAGSGRRLFQWLADAGWEETVFRTTQYMTAVTKCFPGKHPNGKGDRVPSRAEQALCRPFLLREIGLVDPRLIIPVGGLAIKLFYPSALPLRDIIGGAAYFAPEHLHDGALFDLKRARRLTAFDPALPREGRWIVPLPHPSGASLWPNRPANRVLIGQAIGILTALRAAYGWP